MPERIQRPRLPGWTMPPGSVWVGRPGLWGNPFVAGRIVPDRFHFAAGRTVTNPAVAVQLYAEMLAANTDLRDRAAVDLAGHDLVCWCTLRSPCHGDVLLRVAAGGDP